MLDNDISVIPTFESILHILYQIENNNKMTTVFVKTINLFINGYIK